MQAMLPLDIEGENISAAGANVAAVSAPSSRFETFIAVDQVSLTVQRGETFGLIDANGAGERAIIRSMGFAAPACVPAVLVAVVARLGGWMGR